MCRVLSGVIILAFGVCFGCTRPKEAVKPIPSEELDVLERADSMEIFSLNPHVTRSGNNKGDPNSYFRGWQVLGQVAVPDRRKRREVAETLVECTRRSSGRMFHCFEPRHGIRVTHDGETVEFVICYECGFGYSYLGTWQSHEFAVSGYSAELLTSLLEEGGVPLAR